MKSAQGLITTGDEQEQRRRDGRRAQADGVGLLQAGRKTYQDSREVHWASPSHLSGSTDVLSTGVGAAGVSQTEVDGQLGHDAGG